MLIRAYQSDRSPLRLVSLLSVSATFLLLAVLSLLTFVDGRFPLQEPRVLRSSEGHLDVTLSVRPYRFSNELLSFTTRAYCLHNTSGDGKHVHCSVPGPTILCKPGDTLRSLLKLHISMIAVSTLFYCTGCMNCMHDLCVWLQHYID